MRIVILGLLSATLAVASPPPGKGWTGLLNGRDLEGWLPQDPAKGNWNTTASVTWDATNNPLELASKRAFGPYVVNGPKGRVSNLVTARKFGDIELDLEFFLASTSNSGVYLHGLYEIQILDSYGVKDLKYGDCGGVYGRLVDGKMTGGHPPAVNASRPPGQWQSLRIRFRAPRFDASGRKTANAIFLQVLLNGVTVQENIEVDSPTRSAMPLKEAAENPLMLQGDHGPVAYRSIFVRPLPVD